MSGLTLQPKRRERLGDQLYGQILEQIVGGSLKEGDRLPSEKALCAMFEVSRPVVREAMMRLQADGLVVARQGSGTYVQRRPLRAPVALADASDVAGILRCYELRLPLEAEAAALAAERRTQEQLGHIRAALDALTDAIGNRVSASAPDFAFHRAVAEASGNALFVAILDTLHLVIEQSMAAALNRAARDSGERGRRVVEEHERVYEAIAVGDADAARLAMRSHFHRARQRIADRQPEA